MSDIVTASLVDPQPGHNMAEPEGGPMDAGQRQQLAEAHSRVKKIQRVAKVASFNGWVCGIFAALSAPFAFFSLSGFIMTIGLTVIAYNEFKGRELVRQFNPLGGRLLGWNQVGFLSLIIVYCIWQLATGLFAPNPFEAELTRHPELGQVMGSMDDILWLYDAIMVSVYGAVILMTIVFQGYNAYYYFTGGRRLQAYIDETAGWIVDLQRAVGA